MSKTRVQPEWLKPTAADKEPVLKVYNSLTRSKEVFTPMNGRQVIWYSCGPTVYDAAHMGHARSYISFDILRRVLRDYFGYSVFYAMNITDIDDKIIMRARQRHLFVEFKSGIVELEKTEPEQALSQLNSYLRAAFDWFQDKSAKETDADKKAMFQRIELKVSNVLNGGASWSPGETDCLKILETKECSDVLMDYLDLEKGSAVNDNSIFQQLPKEYEEMFHEDMRDLNVLPVDCLTRVSDYIDEICEFIKRIIENGFAYESDGSVYFDTAKFGDTERSGHHYAKLVPEAVGDAGALAEGEGALSTGADVQKLKHHPNDFALWKRSKSGEPSWDSPWGRGRPGWHIECSVMATAVCGDRLDIHTGGVDLKFPHHDNEIAQAEASFNSAQWTNYFLHSGHLTISGCKMSKSLKNFITIREALKKNTARQLRFAFLLHSWKDTLDYSEETMNTAMQYEKMLLEFVLNIKDQLRHQPDDPQIKWSNEELALNKQLMEATANVHAALCDNVDTRQACFHIKDLITATNIYLAAKRQRRQYGHANILTKIAEFVHKIFVVFGAFDENDSSVSVAAIGAKAAKDGLSQSGRYSENDVLAILNIMSKFRDDVRTEAKRGVTAARADHAADGSDAAGELKNVCRRVLELTDRIRDDDLVEVGVRLEDHDGMASTIKLVDKEELLRARQLRLQEQERRKEEKLRREQQRQEAKKKTQPIAKDPFLDNERFSQWDDAGVPTHDASGKELSKSALKKVQKERAKYLQRLEKESGSTEHD